jgi:hypothetical protein
LSKSDAATLDESKGAERGDADTPDDAGKGDIINFGDDMSALHVSASDNVLLASVLAVPLLFFPAAGTRLRMELWETADCADEVEGVDADELGDFRVPVEVGTT